MTTASPTDRPVPISVVDAFTDRPFGGNPAAVCLLESPAPERWMQQLAAEMGLSETAYLVPSAGTAGSPAWELRWFTPTIEVDLCGHATLAAAHLLAETGHVPDGATLWFHTRSGALSARVDGGSVTLDFPATPAEPVDPPPGLAAALGLEPSAVTEVGRSRFDQLVAVTDEAAVRGLQPDPDAVAALGGRGVIVTAPGDRGAAGTGADMVSRYFAPAAGVPEDPVTGSAHCVLGPWWAERLGRTELRAHQASARGGDLLVRVRGDRVELVGTAVTVWRGQLAAGSGPAPAPLDPSALRPP